MRSSLHVCMHACREDQQHIVIFGIRVWSSNGKAGEAVVLERRLP